MREVCIDVSQDSKDEKGNQMNVFRSLSKSYDMLLKESRLLTEGAYLELFI